MHINNPKLDVIAVLCISLPSAFLLFFSEWEKGEIILHIFIKKPEVRSPGGRGCYQLGLPTQITLLGKMSPKHHIVID